MRIDNRLDKVGISLALLMTFLPLGYGKAKPEFDHDVLPEKISAVPEPKKEISVDLGCGVTMDFLLISPGSFLMGFVSPFGHENEIPPHKVTFSKHFYMAKYEVTQEQWETVTGMNPSQFKDAKKPVDSVSWNECAGFIEALNEKVPGLKARLPTEAEWEYACRAGTATQYSFGDSEDRLGEFAWYDGNSGSTTHPVGEKKPNAFGLHDMLGNVSEWCEDYGHRNYKGAPTDGTAWLEGFDSFRVLRGSNWDGRPWSFRSASRYILDPAIMNTIYGFRVVVVR